MPLISSLDIRSLSGVAGLDPVAAFVHSVASNCGWEMRETTSWRRRAARTSRGAPVHRASRALPVTKPLGHPGAIPEHSIGIRGVRALPREAPHDDREMCGTRTRRRRAVENPSTSLSRRRKHRKAGAPSRSPYSPRGTCINPWHLCIVLQSL